MYLHWITFIELMWGGNYFKVRDVVHTYHHK